MVKKEVALKHSLVLFIYIFVVWSSYRYFSHLNQNTEDLIVKPVLWLLPVFFLVKKEKLNLESVGITMKNLFPSIYSALVLGVFFAVLGMFINMVRYGQFDFSANLGETPFYSALFLSFVTGLTEEITFRGYLFNRMLNALKSEWKANILVSCAWAIIHIPIALFLWKLDFMGVAGIFLLTTLYGVGSAFVFARTKNVFSSVLLHVLWGWPIILFR